MTKISNQYSLTNILTADLANSRLGINNVSPTVALDVTGAGKFSGVLTLGSTISNGTYTYTLPSATGTLALTSALSGYLPLTGGTLTGALNGTSAVFSGGVTFGANSRGFIREPAGDVEIGGTAGAALKLYANGVEYAKLAPSTGFTTTLAFSGTSATFSSSVTTSDIIQTNKTGGLVYRAYYGSGNNRTLDVNIDTSNGDAQLTWNTTYNSGWKYYLNNYAARIATGDGIYFSVAANGTAGNTISWINALSITSTGAATFSSSIAATSATFSSSVYFNYTETNTIGNFALALQGGFTGFRQGTDHSFNIDTYNSGTPVNALKIVQSGAATFSSSIASSWHSVNGAIPSSAASTGYLDYSGGGTRLFSVGTSGATKGTFTFIAKGADDSSITPLSITSGGSMLMAKDAAIGINTSDGSDNGYLALCGAGADGENRGGYIYLSGNERSVDQGHVTIGAGNVIGYGSVIAFRTGAGVERMRIIGNGRVLIGTTTDGGYLLYVNGTAAGTSGFANVSDIRLKKDIIPIKNGLDKINKLNGISFNWDKTLRPDLNVDDNNHLGLIAQDVEAILPQVVSTGDDEFNTKTIIYSDIVPVLIEAIKELSAKVSLLENK